MEAKELRVGNFVKWGDKQVHQITVSCFASEWTRERGGFFNQLEPHPLTEMWLLKFGFNRVDNYLELFLHEEERYYSLKFIFDKLPLVYEIDGNRMPLHNIKYVHQLQNLYFALTGEELQIKVEV